MPDTIEVLTSRNNIDVSTSINQIVAQIEKNIISLSETKNYIDVEPIVNLLQVIQNNTEIIVNNPSRIIQIIEQAAASIEVTNVTNKIQVLDKLSEVTLTVQKNIIEFNNNPPNTDVDEAEIMFKKRTDFVSDTLIYKGVAAPGSLTSAAVWRISEITFDENSNDDVAEDFADGNDSFTNVWDDRAVLSYG